jgi:predicted nucleotidyltransferase
VFTAEQRDRVRERLLELARADEDVLGAAITGSYAAGGGDEWSDVDLAFAIRGDLEPAVERWTEILHGELGAVHHWDLRFRGTVYRVFLLPSGLEIDIAFAPPKEFRPRRPTWRTVLGKPGDGSNLSRKTGTS